MEIIEQLKETKAVTLGYFGLREADLDRQYGQGKWLVREILNHLADAETILYDRIRRVIAEPKGSSGRLTRSCGAGNWITKLFRSH
jgi:hypothetical protein